MPDIRKHRGAHPEDRKLFADDRLPALRSAVDELSWLLTRAYAIKSAVKLVGDRQALTERQRLAVSRAACSDQSRDHRARTQIAVADLRNETLIIDGFNLIISIEAARSGGLLFSCRDGCIRDLSSVHGSYRSVNETAGAVQLIGDAMSELEVKSVQWRLDRPVSNSGRLAKLIRERANQNHWPWTVETVFNPDREIIEAGLVVISSDGPLLDQVAEWANFSDYLCRKKLDSPWLVDLS